MNENNDLNIQTTEETIPVEPVVEPSSTEPITPVGPITPVEPTFTNEPQAPKKKSNTAFIIIIIVLAVLLCSALGYIVFDKIKDGQNNNAIESTTSSAKEDSLPTKKDEPTSTPSTTNADTKVVGQDGYGYVTVPSNWYTFQDASGSSAIQYTYATVFTLSLDIVPDTTNKLTAKDAASNYMSRELQNTSATNVQGATVKVGKNSEYTAYQVYSYYPADNTYLVTYWFEAEDGKIHYMALEGPSSSSGVSITDFTDTIPLTFSLKK